MEPGNRSLPLGQVMSRGAVAGLCLGLLATGPSLLSSGFAVAQIMMSVPLIIALMLFGLGFSTVTLLD
jgi:hypothetical protein